MKRPAFQFYPADWRKDVELRSCSIAARGLWIDMMCLAHECEPYGHLTVNGKPMTPAKIAGQVGVSEAMAKKLIAELLENGVVRTTDDGVLYSARMVRDEALRNARAEGGKSGASHGSKGAEHGHKGGRPKKSKGGFETPLDGGPKPPPSSSSSSTKDSVTDVTDGQAVAPTPPPPPPTNARKPAGEEKSLLWATLKTALVDEKTCASLKEAGVLLGKAAKDYGEIVFLDACRETVREPRVNTHTFLIGACERAAGRRAPVNRQEAIEQRNRAVGEQWLAQQGATA